MRHLQDGTEFIMKHLIVKSGKDKVGNALEDIASGDRVVWRQAGAEHELRATDAVPFGFKMALRPIAQDQEIICYGEAIGLASTAIAAGACVHVHNVRGRRGNA